MMPPPMEYIKQLKRYPDNDVPDDIIAHDNQEEMAAADNPAQPSNTESANKAAPKFYTSKGLFNYYIIRFYTLQYHHNTVFPT